MNEIGVGKEVLSYCSPCKLSLAHIIVTMKNDTTPGKTECKTCGAVHNYKNPDEAKKKKTTTRKPRQSKLEQLKDTWMKAMAASDAEPQMYSIKQKFLIGDIVEHPKFGQGIVERSIDNNKIEVMFSAEVKVLLHNKN
jgi:uncharacterized Zn finger protein (UPF0148 family)